MHAVANGVHGLIRIVEQRIGVVHHNRNTAGGIHKAGAADLHLGLVDADSGGRKSIDHHLIATATELGVGQGVGFHIRLNHHRTGGIVGGAAVDAVRHRFCVGAITTAIGGSEGLSVGVHLQGGGAGEGEIAIIPTCSGGGGGEGDLVEIRAARGRRIHADRAALASSDLQQRIGIRCEQGRIPVGILMNAHAQGMGLGEHFIGVGIALAEAQRHGLGFCFGAQVDPAAHRDRLAELNGLRLGHSTRTLARHQISQAVLVELEQVQIVGHRHAAIGMWET